MAKPENSIRKIKDISGSTPKEWEVIPHSLTDGTNLAQVPSTLGQDKYLTVAVDQLQIPAIPQSDGEYILMFKKINGSITATWMNNLMTVNYTDTDGQAKKVMYSDNGTDKDVFYGVL